MVDFKMISPYMISENKTSRSLTTAHRMKYPSYAQPYLVCSPLIQTIVKKDFMFSKRLSDVDRKKSIENTTPKVQIRGSTSKGF